MSSRQNTQAGQFRKKREDTLIKTIEKDYNVDFGVRGDTKLGTYLQNKGLPSLAKALKKVDKEK